MKRIGMLFMLFCVFIQAAFCPPVFAFVEDKDDPDNDRLALSEPLSSDYDYETELAKFPSSYRSLLKKLHDNHPNWIFVAVKPGLTWDEVIEAESYGGRSVIPGSASRLLLSNAEGDYDPETGKYTYRDAGVWVSCNPVTVSFFMDPRNFLNEKYIWQFESLSFDYSQTQDSVESILSGSFMSVANSPKIKYYNREGTRKTLSLKDEEGNRYYPTYSQLIWQAGKDSDISPLYLASKIRLEVGNQSGSVTGKYTTDTGIKYNDQSLDGYYNFYNIAASDGENPISRGLAWAAGYPDADGKVTESTYGRPWTTPARSILNGAPYVADRYIANGQNTGYFIRFNVTPYAVETGRLYSYQYMTSIYGATAEASASYSSYLDLGSIDLGRVFFIPVFNNMPSRSEYPHFSGAKDTAIVTASDGAVLRSTPSVSGDYLTNVPYGTTVTLQNGVVDATAESALYQWQNNPYWFKVTYNGVTGYISAEILKATSSKTIKEGATTQLSLTETPAQKVWYQSSDPGIATVSETGQVTAVSEGTVSIYAYTAHGLAVYGLTVKPKNPVVDIASDKVTVGAIPTQTFAPDGVHPEPVVQYQGTTLTKGTDYTVSYRSNLWPGPGSLVIKGKGNFSGSRTVTFQIQGTYSKYKTTDQMNYRDAPGLSSNVIGSLAEGKTVNVLKNAAKKADGITWYAVKIGEKHYYMSSLGLKKVKTTTKKISDSSITVSSVKTKAFKAKRLKPSITVTDGSTVLVKGTDYTVSYKNNYWPGTATITIKGKGKYSGSRKITFKIKGTYKTFKTKADLYYRDGPGTSNLAVGILPKGTKVKVLSKYSKKVDDLKWVAVRINKKRYFVARKYLKQVK